MAANQAGFSFAANPRPVAPSRTLYRAEDSEAGGGTANLMFDPRVKRGTTFSKPASEPSTELSGGSSPTKSRKVKPATSIFDLRAGARPREPLDLVLHLEEQRDVPEEASVITQTDVFLPRPASPKYVPKKTGVDAGTQIEWSDCLFDFDVEVEPILDVIVGKILEQSVVELEQEGELSALHNKKKALLQRKQVELDGILAQEAAAGAKEAEKRRQLEAHRERIRKEKTAAEKASAARFGHAFASSLLSGVLSHCETTGHFSDPIQLEIEKSFMPSLYARVQARIDKVAQSHAHVDDLLSSVLALQLSRQAAREKADREAAEAEQQRREEEERKKFMRIFVRLSFEELGLETMVGPVVVQRTDTVGVAESKIHQWLVDNPKEETASLLKEGAPRLRLCLSGKPIAPTRPLLKCVDGTHGPLELLPVKAGADASGSDSGDE